MYSLVAYLTSSQIAVEYAAIANRDRCLVPRGLFTRRIGKTRRAALEPLRIFDAGRSPLQFEPRLISREEILTLS